jgi:hypothetical protein
VDKLETEIADKILQKDLANIIAKVNAGKTLTTAERKLVETNQTRKPWELLEIHRTSFYKYKKLGMPEIIEDAKVWLQTRAGLAQQGSGKISIGGKEYTAQDLLDLRGEVMRAQADNLHLKNQMEKLNVAEREGKLCDIDLLNETLVRILYPLRKALDQLPENIAPALNPDDPTRAETILQQELDNIYADLTKALSQDEQVNGISV